MSLRFLYNAIYNGEKAKKHLEQDGKLALELILKDYFKGKEVSVQVKDLNVGDKIITGSYLLEIGTRKAMVNIYGKLLSGRDTCILRLDEDYDLTLKHESPFERRHFKETLNFLSQRLIAEGDLVRFH
jgi:hypothetical protein